MSSKSARLAELSDLLRTTFLTGKVVFSCGIRALDEIDREAIVTSVRAFAAFTPENDPYGERDFDRVEQYGVGSVFWKIDYCDFDYCFHSPDPADAAVRRYSLPSPSMIKKAACPRGTCRGPAGRQKNSADP